MANSKRFHRTLKEEAIRPKIPLTLDDAKRITCQFIEHYNSTRLHSVIGYVTPADRVAGRHTTIFTQRDNKLDLARKNRQIKRQQQTAQPA
ncbi:MAG: integrase core domain-containing protein [Verrucomicrobiota bacterium]|nr:integrase core domain-containing protein [Verrucomicrobiota bacterium]